MLNSREIRNVKFSKAVGGYKQEEVDILLDKIEADYDQFERSIREMSSKIDTLTAQVEEYKTSQGSIQNVLVSAQKLADQIVEEAKVKSSEIVASAEKSIESITEQEKALSAAFERKAEDRKQTAEMEFEKAISTARAKQESIEKATADSVHRQQVLFNKIKLEIAAFKTDITNKYKEHLEILSSLPDTVAMDPAEIAEAVSAAIDRMPSAEQFVGAVEEPKPQLAEEAEEEPASNFGFVVHTEPDDEEDGIEVE